MARVYTTSLHSPGTDRSDLERSAGFTLLEVVITISLLVVAMLSISLVLLNTTEERDESRARLQVLDRAQSLMEEIQGSAPQSIVDEYDGTTWVVDEVSPVAGSDTVLTVQVDATDPRLILVVIVGEWQARGQTQTLYLQTEVFDVSA